MDDSKPVFPATVAHVLTAYKVVINKGAADGVQVGQRFLVYAVSKDPIVDPETREPLGHLEIVKGTGKVVHVQERMATLESDIAGPNARTVRRYTTPTTSMWLLMSGRQEEEVVDAAPRLPFEGATSGDKAKPI
jgi:hypothetical protein